MRPISRRSSFGFAIGGLAVLGGCAQTDQRPPAAATPAPPAPPAPAQAAPAAAAPAAPANRRVAGAAMRRAFTPSDWALYRDCINKTMNAPTGREWRWHNPQSGNGGFMATTSPSVTIRGRACRNFEETITLSDGRRESLNGRACKRADGGWDIVA